MPNAEKMKDQLKACAGPFNWSLFCLEHSPPALMVKCFVRRNPHPCLPLSGEPNSPWDLIARFNSGALLQVRNGNFDRATSLCHRAIEICLMGLKSYNFDAWLKALFWPCLNLGRLAGMRGEVETGLEIFRKVCLAHSRVSHLELAGYRIQVCANSLPVMAGEVPDRLFGDVENIFLVESLRCLLAAERFSEADSFMENLRHDLPRIDEALFVEMRSLILTRLARPEAALNWLSTISVPSENLSSIPLLVAEAEALLFSGDVVHMSDCIERVNRITNKLAETWKGSDLVSFSPGHIYLRAALCMLLAQRPDLAYYYARLAFNTSHEEAHEVVRIRALTLLAGIESEHNIEKNSSVAGTSRSWRPHLEKTCQLTLRRFEKALGLTALGAFGNKRKKQSLLKTAYTLAAGVPSLESKRLCSLIEHLEPRAPCRAAPEFGSDAHSESSYNELMGALPQELIEKTHSASLV